LAWKKACKLTTITSTFVTYTKLRGLDFYTHAMARRAALSILLAGHPETVTSFRPFSLQSDSGKPTTRISVTSSLPSESPRSAPDDLGMLGLASDDLYGRDTRSDRGRWRRHHSSGRCRGHSSIGQDMNMLLQATWSWGVRRYPCRESFDRAMGVVRRVVAPSFLYVRLRQSTCLFPSSFDL
jgi:hypothetical protein